MPSFVDEIIVVDNDSTDNTVQKAEECGAKVVREKRRGYGYAIKTGLAKATSDCLVVIDGDDTYSVKEIAKLLDYLIEEEKDVVFGCRYPLIEKDAQPMINVVSNYFITALANILFRINSKDILSGMMVFKKAAAGRLKIMDNGMGFSTEVKIRALLTLKSNYGERHISYLPRKGKTKFRKIHDSFVNLRSVVSVWFEYYGFIALAVWVGFIGIALRLFQYLLNRSLWADDAALATNIIQRSFAGLWQRLDYGQFATVGFMMLEKLITVSFGNSEYALRFFPLLCGILSIVLFYKMATAVIGKAYIPLAMAYFALSGRLIYYSAQVKEYSVDILMSIVFCFGIIYASKRPLTRSMLFIYAFAGSLAIWFLVKLSFMLVAFALSMTAIYIYRKQPVSALKLVPVYCLWIFSFAAFYAVFSANYTKDYVSAVLMDFRYGIITSHPKSVPYLVHCINVARNMILALTGARFPFFLLGLFLVGLLRMRRKDKENFFIFSSPILSACLAAFLFKYPLAERLILFLSPFIIVFITRGVMEVAGAAFRSHRLVGAVFLILVISTLPCFNKFNALVLNMNIEETRSVIDYVKQRFQEGDLLCVYSSTRQAFEYYAARSGFKRDFSTIERKSRVLKESVEGYKKNLDSLRGKDRVWVILSHTFPGHREFIVSYLDGIGKRIDMAGDTGAWAYLYDLS